ncbi:MAG: PTS system mannose/fructose/sorbose family transporter subunit IID, partial [Holdemania filiformis]
HSVFFNCEPNLTNIILGMDIAIEEEMGAEGLETVAGIKASLMGPFAGIGDTLFTSVLATIFGSIAVTTALEGSYFGIILWEIWLFFVMFGLRPYLMQLGYTQGIKLVTTLSGKLNQITQAASVLGIMVVGSMVASLVKVNFGTLTIMGTEFDLQTKLFDAIMPKFGAVLVVALCYWVLGKIGMKSSRLILMIMALAILCSFLGVLVP